MQEGGGLVAVGSNHLWSSMASWVTMVHMVHIHCFAESYCCYSSYLLLPTGARLKHEYILIFLLYNFLTTVYLPLDLNGLRRRERERNLSIPSNKILPPNTELLFPPLFDRVHLS